MKTENRKSIALLSIVLSLVFILVMASSCTSKNNQGTYASARPNYASLQQFSVIGSKVSANTILIEFVNELNKTIDVHNLSFSANSVMTSPATIDFKTMSGSKTCTIYNGSEEGMPCVFSNSGIALKANEKMKLSIPAKISKYSGKQSFNFIMTYYDDGSDILIQDPGRLTIGFSG